MPDPLGPFEYTWPFYAGFLLAYLVGSIPFGLLLTRFAGLGDIRAIGSRNIGATNVLRTGRKGLAAATLLLDGGKGIVAVAVGWQFGTDMAVLAAVGVVLGHCFPVWLKFKGGKGVATAIGVWLALVPNVGVVVCGLWLAIAFVFRYSSVAALVAMAVAPFLAWHLEGPQIAQAGGAIAAIIWLRHYQNIRRLLKGEESKISFRKK
ncbi:glycerol-3-phosphate 1-O-acyltransferase PlsY [Thalassobaculum salexigens]|uniref:glycerol-3-phosphate 1-O-acyltransferase PlsY n=1 Tax=Thalassobaculum salexigens TaxID=455360 RepID=UPI00040446B9|nr:glycerol-3-phosphate 1-O-acyltransferase PlsY [Thalassobaculum salexigens]